MIKVERKNCQKFMVVVNEENSIPERIITLDVEYYLELTKRNINKEELIKRSFKFLLERESKESILLQYTKKE